MEMDLKRTENLYRKIYHNVLDGAEFIYNKSIYTYGLDKKKARK